MSLINYSALPRIPVPNSDIICAWANGFRVEFRYTGSSYPGGPERTIMDPTWYLCGPWYSNFANNEHRIHEDDVAAWENFKSRPVLDVAICVRKQIINYIRKLGALKSPHTLSYRVLADRLDASEDIF